MNRDKLWQEYSKTKDREIKQKLIEEYIYLVKIIAGRMYNYYGSKVEYDDLIGFGVIGLIDSIERYDISKNIKFETYAQIRIKGTIIDNIRKLDWVPRSLRKKSKEIQSSMFKLENKLGRTPSNHELAEYLNISLKEVEDILADTNVFNVVSLENILINKEEYNNIDNKERIKTPEVVYEEKELKKILADIIDRLPEKEKMVISLYYFDELTYREIGYVLDLSESRISQIHSKAILRLKNQLIKEGFIES
ncbi:RNA polymerase sigma-28 (SigD/FliA/WhiG) subunit [Keratinibaculum paraultunense]|uniref:RNA polymerase sigma-28 (SigD/FliA/WhiG) subunit n=1 Tax=Keratinibaculum paraultunense TaxID=1278232 RepID=A0A4R3KZX0_9FIRM|nr:FliA/WhiG family RNA polymerase sigma factor [Keratinibaculum paraultunense]QQY80711.1 FliA/WhiG family RNA polymerase sigma factor [Keratinibaculum paraultunense]TCS89684.1 RNA polymerase sigma-28 (SigD/FliA/WhiG) subunit [Keratinibaculum paraultunense]